MLINKTYKIEINPNNKQKTLLEKSFGVSRFAYNWGLARVNEKLNTPSAYELSKEINKIKKIQFPWVKEVSKWCLQTALENLELAFKNFFKYCKTKRGIKVGYPRFKKKNTGNSFKIYDNFLLINDKLRIAKIGYIKSKEIKNIEGKICFIVITRKANKYFALIGVELEKDIVQINNNKILGIDLGIKNLVTCSDGTTYSNSNALYNKVIQLRKLNKRFSRQKKGSKRWNKTKLRLGKLHLDISNLRKDVIHKVTTEIVKTKQPQCIAVESLNVFGMIKNRRISRRLLDASFYELKRQLEYKSKWYGSGFIVVDRFFPSSKLCSCCGWKDENQTLRDRVFTCKSCNNIMERDLNASINIMNEGKQLMSVGSTANAHGEVQACKEPLRSENQALRVVSEI